MLKSKPVLIVALVIVCVASLWAAVGSQISFTLGTTPGNPAAGKIRLWANTASGLLECLTSSGGNCLNAGGVTTLLGGANVIAGALAANAHIIITGDVTQTTSVITVSQNNVLIECNPGVKITRSTASVDLFSFTGTNVRISGCTLDGGSVGNGIAISMGGTREFADHNTLQNWNASASQNGLISSLNGTLHEITDNQCVSEAQECFSALAPSGTLSYVRIASNTIQSWAGTANGAIHINNVGTSTTQITVTDNFCTMANGSRNCIYAGAAGGIPTDVFIAGNDCQITGAISVVGCYNFNAGQRWRVIGNNVNVDPLATVTFGLNVSDCGGSVIANNTIYFGGAGALSGTGILALDGSTTEAGDCVISGNTVWGFTMTATTGGIVIGTVGVSNNRYNIIGNTVTFPSSASTGYGILVYCDPTAFGGSGTPTCKNINISNNIIHGQSGAGSVAIQLKQGNGGTISNASITANNIDSVNTGINIGASVTDTKIGAQKFSGTTTLFVDSGTTSHYDPQCHIYNVSNSSTNLAVTQDGGTATNTAKAAALTQSLPLFTMTPLMVITGFTIKTATAFAGTATLTSTFGDSAGTATSYSSTTFNLQTAVSNTQFQDTSGGGIVLPKHITEAGSNTFNLALTATTNNISAISAGSVNARVCWVAP